MTAIKKVDAELQVPGGYLHTLGRSLEVLVSLADGPSSVASLCKRNGVERSSMYRIIRSLEHHGFVQRDKETGQYRLGLLLWELATSALPGDVRDAARKHVSELAQRCGETVHLAVYDSGEVVYIDKGEGSQPIRSYTRLGGRAPAYCVATGKALLAYVRDWEKDLQRIGGLTRHSAATITSMDELRAELEKVRRSGIAVNRGEWRKDVGGLATPIFDPHSVPAAAIGVSGPVRRILSHRAQLEEELKSVSKAISAEMGA